jgi:hypothetical protein
MMTVGSGGLETNIICSSGARRLERLSCGTFRASWLAALDDFSNWLALGLPPAKAHKNKATHRGRVTVALLSEFAVGDNMFHPTGNAETTP